MPTTKPGKHHDDAARYLAPRAVDPRLADGHYDRFVKIMRILLPAVAAILLLAALFWPILQPTEVSFTLSRADVAESNDKIRFIEPVYQGKDADGRAFMIRAASGVQDTPDAPRIRFTGVEAKMELKDGISARLAADAAAYFVKEERMMLERTAELTTTDGKRFAMRRAVFDMKAKKVYSDAPSDLDAIEGSGPFGAFSARRFNIDIDGRTAIFDGGVKMTIHPNRIRKK